MTRAEVRAALGPLASSRTDSGHLGRMREAASSLPIARAARLLRLCRGAIERGELTGYEEDDPIAEPEPEPKAKRQRKSAHQESHP